MLKKIIIIILLVSLKIILERFILFINSLTKTESVIYPTLPNLILCSNFSIFFQDKVSNIISKNKFITNNVAFSPLCYDILLVYGVYFDYFSSTSFSEVLDLMLASKSSSPIDTLPLSLFHKLTLY